MKKILLAIPFLVSSFMLSAQGLFDVVKYSNLDIMGTARYMSLAGSMGAIGGDPSAIVDNPGALGIYRSSEISFTLNATPSVTFARSSVYDTKAKDFHFNFNHISYVLAIPSGKETGYVSSNLSFTYNRMKDFNRTVHVRGENMPSMTEMMADMSSGFNPSALTVDNIYAPYLSVLGYQGYLINPGAGVDSIYYSPVSGNAAQIAYRGVENGRVEEYDLTYAANIGHYLYIGAGVGLQSMSYRLTSASGEQFTDRTGFQLSNVFSAVGIGAVLRVGVIARPVPFMRIGFSFQSPVWYSVSENYYGAVSSTTINSETDRVSDVNFSTKTTPNGYDFNSPLKFQASVGFVIGKMALVNFDYQYTDNKGMKLIDNSSDDLFYGPHFSVENADIKRNTVASHLFKLGAEFRVAQQFSLRAGFAYKTANMSQNSSRLLMDNTARTDVEMFHNLGSLYGAAGLGYRYNGFGIDISYMYARHNQQFAPYQQGAVLMDNGYFGLPENARRPASVADVSTIRHNVVMTLLYKF
ncbi:MAG: OmpP1/FadL family transporter [Candidatus Aphodosoma sp.]